MLLAPLSTPFAKLTSHLWSCSRSLWHPPRYCSIIYMSNDRVRAQDNGLLSIWVSNWTPLPPCSPPRPIPIPPHAWGFSELHFPPYKLRLHGQALYLSLGHTLNYLIKSSKSQPWMDPTIWLLHISLVADEKCVSHHPGVWRSLYTHYQHSHLPS